MCMCLGLKAVVWRKSPAEGSSCITNRGSDISSVFMLSETPGNERERDGGWWSLKEACEVWYTVNH